MIAWTLDSRRPAWLTALFAISLCLPDLALSSSVRSVSLEEMLTRSEAVFEGQVVAEKSGIDEHGMVRTYVTFRIDDLIKGQTSESLLTLGFLGGRYGGVTIKVSDLETPTQGEYGIYFVESVNQPLVNPLYGWHQGRTLIKTASDGQPRMFSATGEKILDISPDAHGTRTGKSPARGIVDGASTTISTEAITLGEFKRRLRAMLASAPSE